MPLLTVITVVKDDVPGLARTVASVCDQVAADFELVVVDGSGDRDSVPATLASQPDLTASYSWAEPRGVYAAMNDGLRLATGDYVYFLNAGDTLALPDGLARLTAQLSKARPVWAFGGVRFLQEDGTEMPEPPWSYAQEYRHGFARGRFPAHQGVVVSAQELQRQGGFDTTYKVAADYASILRCAHQSPPLELEFTLAEFSVGGLSSQQWRVAQSEFHRARRDILAPKGAAALRESAYTWRSLLATQAYRTLWAPGRPAHRMMRRLRQG